MGCHFLPQGIFPTEGSNPAVSHCRQALLPSEPPGKSISSVQLLSAVWLFATPWITARQASLSITNPRSLLKVMPIEVHSGSQFWHIRIHWNTIYLKIQILKLYSRPTEWESWGGILMLLRSLWSGKLEITDFYRSEFQGVILLTDMTLTEQNSTSLIGPERVTLSVYSHNPAPGCSGTLFFFVTTWQLFRKFPISGTTWAKLEEIDWLFSTPKIWTDLRGEIHSMFNLAAEYHEWKWEECQVTGTACLLASGAFSCLQPGPLTLLPVASAPSHFLRPIWSWT